jgi:ElaB/YqjD/DUF883 family membrane-anchored ribosome-binding protein
METHLPAFDMSQSRAARDRVIADLKTLVSDTDDLLKATAGDLSEKAKEARARVSRGLDRAKQSMDELQVQGLESARAAMKQADSTIRDHPYESIGLALGIGLVIGSLLRRK